jgi:hypothetical protein
MHAIVRNALPDRASSKSLRLETPKSPAGGKPVPPRLAASVPAKVRGRLPIFVSPKSHAPSSSQRDSICNAARARRGVGLLSPGLGAFRSQIDCGIPGEAAGSSDPAAVVLGRGSAKIIDDRPDLAALPLRKALCLTMAGSCPRDRPFHKSRRILAELAHHPEMIGLLHRHRLQRMPGQSQQLRIGIGHQHRRMRGHHHLADC